MLHVGARADSCSIGVIQHQPSARVLNDSHCVVVGLSFHRGLPMMGRGRGRYAGPPGSHIFDDAVFVFRFHEMGLSRPINEPTGGKKMNALASKPAMENMALLSDYGRTNGIRPAFGQANRPDRRIDPERGLDDADPSRR
ncbi:hypothetical protein LMTR13_24350 [Bradyrhizobium icense]|uniref:Uncharacterized protein n=1 Tax=Bradyrhizobium icense TaxID=1274631 RepID=A0A1B1UJE4_9BRAD|nr:hypothetical protein LMTR13_24350 [Bradyrhizobium icense]